LASISNPKKAFHYYTKIKVRMSLFGSSTFNISSNFGTTAAGNNFGNATTGSNFGTIPNPMKVLK